MGKTSSDTFGGVLNHSKIGSMEVKTHKELPGSCGWKNSDGDLDAQMKRHEIMKVINAFSGGTYDEFHPKPAEKVDKHHVRLCQLASE